MYAGRYVSRCLHGFCKGNINYFMSFLQRTLLVNEDASQEDIKRNYKKLALLVHPDRYTSDVVKADRAMKVLNAAYEILGDQDKREKHRQDQQQQESSRFSEDLNDFMASLKNLLQCDVCGGLHAVTQTDRDPLAGRYCGECRDYHRASPGEVWVENILWMKELYFCRKDDGSKGASKVSQKIQLFGSHILLLFYSFLAKWFAIRTECQLVQRLVRFFLSQPF